jgi:tripartite-type tricarboxylate transporter receptor subunit TctC
LYLCCDGLSALAGVACAAVFAFAVAPSIAQQTYAARPFRLIMPLPPGGGADFIGRVIG